MDIKFLIKDRVKDLVEHFSTDGWDLEVDYVIYSLLEELKESSDFQSYLTDMIESECKASRVKLTDGTEVFRRNDV